MNDNKKPHYHGHRIRLKDKFIDSPSTIADYELLELLLGYVIPRRDVKPIAKDILAYTKSINDILSTDISTVDGVGKESCIFFTALGEFYNRCQIAKVKASTKIISAKDVYEYFKFSIAMGTKESFALLYLNAKNIILTHEILNKGTVDAASVFPREVVESAIKACAVNVIAVHNHPSGDTTPSREDVDVTSRIKDALAVVDITLLDHIIISKNSYFSLEESKYIANLRTRKKK